MPPIRDRCPPGYGVPTHAARPIAARTAGLSSRRRAARALATVCLALLGGCGGGVFLGVGIGDFGDQPPAVALTSSLSEAPAGATVRLVAAASDDFGVDSVAFYREEAAGPPTLLASDPRAPYQIDTVIPTSSVGTVWRYFARAFDGAGQHSDSPPIEITVR